MTVETEISRSGPYAGAGTTGPFTVGFRFLADTHLRVIKTSIDSIDTDLTLTTDYSVTGAGGLTGTVTLVIALAVGESLTIIRNVPFVQDADYVDNDAFPAESHEQALDLLTMQTQQIKEAQDRALALPPTVSGSISTELPLPVPNNIISWNLAGDGLANLDPAGLAGIVTYGTFVVDKFNGTGAQVDFLLTGDPLIIGNLDIAVGGVVQTAGVNYTLIPPRTLRFLTGAPPVGTNNIQARYGNSIALGAATAVSGQTVVGTALITAADASAARTAIGLGLGAPANVASASTVNLSTAVYLAVNLTGTVPVTGWTMNIGQRIRVNFTANTPLTYNATTNKINGGTSVTTAAGDSADIYYDGTTTFLTLTRADGTAVTTLPLRTYFSGLGLSTAGSSTTITVAPGQATDSTNTTLMNLASSIAKTTAAWAVGSGNGGKLSTAAIAPNTMYYFHEIIRLDTGVVDIGFDVATGAPTLPTNYTKSRYIGAWPTDASSNWLPMTQVGGDFYYKTPVSDINGVTCSTTAALVVMSVPKGRKVKLYFNAVINGTAGNAVSYLSDPDNADILPAVAGFPVGHVQSQTSTSGQVWTDTSGRIRHREAGAALNLSVSTLGWYDPL
jgi:hypothetical protein